MSNPFNAKLQSVIVRKFNGSETIDITPQTLELVLYQSIFSPVIKGEIVIHDFVNLLDNFPIVGEETIELTLTQGTGAYDDQQLFARFVVAGIRDVEVASTNRMLTYVIEIVSFEAFENAKVKVSHRYDLTIEEMMDRIIKDYLKSDKLFTQYGDTTQIRDLVIPNIRPFAALEWLCRHAVSKDYNQYHTFLFYETLAGGAAGVRGLSEPAFTFKAMQRPTWKGFQDQAALEGAKRNSYFYISNVELLKNPSIAAALGAQGLNEDRLVLSVKFNKRYATLEKILAGYFENEYVEINMLQKDHVITSTNLNQSWGQLPPAIDLNTRTYINDVINTKTENETSPRVRYIINNFVNRSDPSRREKFGRSVRSHSAFGQIDLSIGVLTDLTLRPGDVIYVGLPEFHGFEQVNTNHFVTGYFLLSEIKTVIRPSGETSSLLRINKDGYENEIFAASRFNQGGGGSGSVRDSE